MKFKPLCLMASAFLLASTSAFAGKIKIIEATYGAPKQTVNVTEKIKQLALAFGENPDFIVITPSNSLVKKDPARGIPKKLTIKYTEEGTEKTKVIAERQTGFIGSDIKLTKEFSLIKAFYGAKDKWKDVTSLVGKLLNKQGEQEVNNASMGGDPIPRVGKRLVIYYSKDNKLNSKSINEKAKFNFSGLYPQPAEK